jgi:hypothetical protein
VSDLNDEPCYACDLCGCDLNGSDDIRYEVRIDVRAAPDCPKVTFEQLVDDHRPQIRRLIREVSRIEPSEATRQVASRFAYVLCTTCRRRFAEDPLGPHRRTEA